MSLPNELLENITSYMPTYNVIIDHIFVRHNTTTSIWLRYRVILIQNGKTFTANDQCTHIICLNFRHSLERERYAVIINSYAKRIIANEKVKLARNFYYHMDKFYMPGTSICIPCSQQQILSILNGYIKFISNNKEELKIE